MNLNYYTVIETRADGTRCAEYFYVAARTAEEAENRVRTVFCSEGTLRAIFISRLMERNSPSA